MIKKKDIEAPVPPEKRNTEETKEQPRYSVLIHGGGGCCVPEAAAGAGGDPGNRGEIMIKKKDIEAPVPPEKRNTRIALEYPLDLTIRDLVNMAVSANCDLKIHLTRIPQKAESPIEAKK